VRKGDSVKGKRRVSPMYRVAPAEVGCPLKMVPLVTSKSYDRAE